MTYKKHILLLLTILSITLAVSQDIHFSQFFANPVSYNPANTGFFKGNFRIGVNHKEQWPWAVDGKYTNYNTSSAYADFTFLDNMFNKVDWAGIGVNFVNDQAGDGTLRSNKINVALSYHKGLDKYHKHFVSLGFTVGYVIRDINFKELYFNNQWEDRVGFVKELPNYENLATERFGYLDIGFGVQARNLLSPITKLTYGFTILHINKPKETFYNQSNNLGYRYLAHAVVEYQIGEKYELMGSAYFTFQKQSMEGLFGALLNLEMKKSYKQKTSKIYTGVFYRWNDALAPIVGYQYNKTRLLVNFDINLSKLSKMSRGDGGVEISIVHVGNWSNKSISNRKMNCYDF